MREPTTSNFPQGKYEDPASLFGTPANTKILTVYGDIVVDTASIQVNEGDSVCSSIQTPVYLIFESGELWFVQSGGFNKNIFNRWQFSLDSTAEQRALHGSPLQPHMKGEKVFLGMVSSHVNQLKQVAKSTQKYHFLILDTDAQRIAYAAGAVQGERILVRATRRIYYCFQNGVLTWVNRVHHEDLDNLTVNSHTQYYLKSSADAYHTGLGDHILSGNDHDHTSTNQGAAVTKIRSGPLANIPSPAGVIGALYFATDDQGGTLYITADGSTWEKVGGIPTGAIAPFNGACPAGWTRYIGLDSRYPLGATSTGSVSGGNTHSHTFTDMVQHYHSINGQTVTLSDGGSHNHTISVGAAYAGSSSFATYGGNASWNSESAGSHSHSASVAARNTGSVGTGAPATQTATTEPMYQEVVFCKKD